MTEGIFVEDLIGINTLDKNAEMRGSTPMVEQLIHIAGDLASGTISVTVQSYFGLGKGMVIGVNLYTSQIAAAHLLGASAVLGSGAGEVDIVISSTDASDTDTLDLYVGIVGKIIPKDV
jgi:hypothetical protein